MAVNKKIMADMQKVGRILSNAKKNKTVLSTVIKKQCQLVLK